MSSIAQAIIDAVDPLLHFVLEYLANFFPCRKMELFHFLNVSVLYSLNVFNRVGIHVSVSRSKIFFLFYYLFILAHFILNIVLHV